MDQKKIDRAIIVSAAVSVLLVGLFELLRMLTPLGLLPFGFRVSGPGVSGVLLRIEREEIGPLLRSSKPPKHLIFTTDLFAGKAGHVFLHVNRPDLVGIMENGLPVHLGGRQFYNIIGVHRGFNRLLIHYTPPAADPAGLSLSLSEGVLITPFTFYRLVLPARPFSASRHLFHFTRLVDYLKSLGFLAALALALYRIILILRQKRELTPSAEKLAAGGWVFTFVVNLLAVQTVLAFLLQFMKKSMTSWWCPAAACAFAGGWVLIERKRGKAWSDRHGASMFLITLAVVLIFTFIQSGSLLPLEPVGQGDLVIHLPMIKNLQVQGRALDAGYGRFYPQAIHAVIVSWSRLLGLQPEEFLTLFSLLFLTLLLFALYRIGSETIPGLSAAVWLSALATNYWPYIFQNVLSHLSFPAVFAVTFFFAALFLQLRSAGPPAALALAAALAVYPYFALPFLAAMGMLILSQAPVINRRRLLDLLLRLLPALAVIGLYAWIFLQAGFPQQKEGFYTHFVINPLLSLRFWNTFLAIAGLVILLPLARARPLLAIFVGLLTGFLGNFLPYALFSATSAYYVLKNMLYLIAFSSILVAAALAAGLKRWTKKRWIAATVAAAALLVMAADYWSTVNAQPPTPRGLPAVDRWLRTRLPPAEEIWGMTADENMKAIMYLTIGTSRKIQFLQPGSVPPPPAHWLLVDNLSSPPCTTSALGREMLRRGDFSIYLRQESNDRKSVSSNDAVK